MNEKEKLMWESIKQFPLDEKLEEYGFTTRLAYENQWTDYFTRSAIEEYKKFIFLASISNTMVSPSEIVDIVWHQHLIFTQSYQKLCQLVGKNIQHIPSTHNPAESATFATAKNTTKELYEKYFGEQNPMFWDNHYDQTKPNYFQNKIIITIAFVSLGFLPAYYLLKSIIVKFSNPEFPILMLVLGMLSLGIAYNVIDTKMIALSWNFYENLSKVKNLNLAEVLYLEKLNTSKLIHSCIDNLIRKENIELKSSSRMIEKKGEYEIEDHLELTCLNVLEEYNIYNYKQLFATITLQFGFKAIEGAVNKLKKELQDTAEFTKISVLYFIYLVPVLYILLTRLVLGIQRDKPVVFISIETIVYVVLSMLLFRKLFYVFFTKHIPTILRTKATDEQRNIWSWPYLGPKENYSNAFKPLLFEIEHSQNSSWTSSFYSRSGSSCGSSCGSMCGSSCGGGCGGCGGD